uniref:von Willebrand factor A domain containing 5B1 n=1 Tax=Salvator merianae TaxID=96440 RepID=A0A8D0BM88_SALMN
MEVDRVFSAVGQRPTLPCEDLGNRKAKVGNPDRKSGVEHLRCLDGPPVRSPALPHLNFFPHFGNVSPSAQVSLQLACGSFLLNKAFCDAINIPLEKLKWTSPFACHRMALSPSVSWGQHISAITIHPSSRPESLPSPPESQADSGRGSEADNSELQSWLTDLELQQKAEPEGMLWATAVALAWLEHSSASYFIEWELVAAKASLWLSEQDFPEGRSLLAVKAAAQQLFVLLRHWDENLEFNLLCYNPKNV